MLPGTGATAGTEAPWKTPASHSFPAKPFLVGYSSVRCTLVLEAPMGPSCLCLAAPTASSAVAAAHKVPGCHVPDSLLLAASPVLAPALTCELIPVLALHPACCLFI